MKKGTTIKTVVWVVVLFVIKVATNIYGTIVTNSVAMNQMQINDESYAIQQAYNNFTMYAPFVLVIIILLTYLKEIKILINYIRRKLNEKI